jgi:putative FmdB family regulatory protein
VPTYSYKCTECGTAFDIQQAFTDDSLTECPNCGGKLRKVFSAVGVTFNGSGFYRNDSRAGQKSGSGSAASPSSGDSSSSSAAPKSDSKPSAPTESKKAASPTKAAS